MTELQRVRLLDATFAVVAEDGYRRMTARRVSGRAGVSNKTFYDLFSDREDCFLAAFDHAVDRIAGVVLPAWEGEKEWATRIRVGLGALLGFLDRESALRSLVFVEALGAGPRVLERRAQILETLGRAVEEGHTGMKGGGGLPPLTAEGVVGGAFGVIHARLLQRQPAPLTGLLGALMATIVLPYRGQTAAARELKRPTIEPTSSAVRDDGAVASRERRGRVGGRSQLIDFRPTQRTQMVLAAVAELGGRGSNPNNREVSDRAQVSDQGQISKLLSRLEGLGLLQNTGGHTHGIPNAWQLTPHGEQVLHATRPHSQCTTGHTNAPETAR